MPLKELISIRKKYNRSKIKTESDFVNQMIGGVFFFVGYRRTSWDSEKGSEAGRSEYMRLALITTDYKWGCGFAQFCDGMLLGFGTNS